VPINPEYNNPSVALNVAIRMARGGLLIMSPPECYPLNDNIRAARAITEKGTLKVCVFGRALAMCVLDNGILGRDRWYPRSEYEMRERINKRISVFCSERVESAWGTRGPVHRAVPYFMVFRKIDHEAVNGFDEDFVRGYSGEDSDYTKRLSMSGVGQVWDDRCSVIHQWHPTIGPGPIGKQTNYSQGFRVNLDHEQGPSDMVRDEVVF
jgi:hypothetical protein